MKFADIPAHDELKQALVGAVTKNKMAHAQLFSGIPGGGALPMALAYSQFILCSSKTETDSCGTCPNCVRVQKGVHPDVHYFFPRITVKEKDYEKRLPEFLNAFRNFIVQSPFGLVEDFANSAGFENKNMLISKDDSRRLIRSVSMKSVEGGTKIILVWLPEYFHPAAANAILKVLEEPPANTVYMLVTNAYESLLSTITSRSLLFHVPPFSQDEIEAYLISRGHEESNAAQMSKLAGGSIGEALRLNEADENMAYGEFRQWMLDCLGNKFASLVERSEAFAKSGKIAQKSTIAFALNILRETMVVGQSELATRKGSEGEFITKFDKFITPAAKQVMYEELNASLIHLERNANAKMVHFHLSSRFSQLLVK